MFDQVINHLIFHELDQVHESFVLGSGSRSMNLIAFNFETNETVSGWLSR